MEYRRVLSRTTMLFVWLAEVGLVLRLIFNLFNADRTNSFVNWVFSMTDTLLLPLRGIFPDQTFDHDVVLDFKALFAIMVYALLGYLVTVLVSALPRPRAERQVGLRKWLRNVL